MSMVYVGGDASKGYADFHIENHKGEELARFTLDDTFAGHQKLREHLQQFQPETRIIIGMEASGGVERNWLYGLRNLGWHNLVVLKVNPLAVKKLRDVRLHEAITDPSSARAVAKYLRSIDGSQPHLREPELDEARQLENFVAAQTEQCSAHRTRLQGLLVNSHPELVQYTRRGIPDWVLRLVSQYPTTAELARATVPDLVKIPYLTAARAKAITAAAKSSVASASSWVIRELAQELCEEILRLDLRITALRKQLHTMFAEDEAYRIYCSFKGVGKVTSLYLRLLLGDCSRFHSANALVAFCGLDPRIHHSGDKKANFSISKRGDSRVRALLFTAALNAIKEGGHFHDFYKRMVIRGKAKKVALVAVMAKILRVLYACQLKRTAFRPDYESNRLTAPGAHLVDKAVSLCLQAPVSAREASRRKKAADHQKRGQASKNMVCPLPSTT